MSRRTQVVRTGDQGGMGAPRTLGGCEVLCAVAEGGDVQETTTIASIDVDSGTDYRRCFVRGSIAYVNTYLAWQYEWDVGIGPILGGVVPSESPHWIVTPDPTTPGNIPLTKVMWAGEASLQNGLGEWVIGEGGTVEFWIDFNLIYTFHSDSLGFADNHTWVDLTDRNIRLVPGQEVYFKCISGVWGSGGGGPEGLFAMRGSGGRPAHIVIDWPQPDA